MNIVPTTAAPYAPDSASDERKLSTNTPTARNCNMLTTGTFIRRGYVYGNLMVNVQPKNTKLRDRARRIVAKAAGVSAERASELLAASGDSVRAAIVMHRAGVDRASAERLLEAAGGRVAAALEKMDTPKS